MRVDMYPVQLKRTLFTVHRSPGFDSPAIPFLIHTEELNIDYPEKKFCTFFKIFYQG
jgi:hypothetical protein